jgi:hypothetical protein
VDGVKVGSGLPGPLTKMLAAKYTEVVTGADLEFRDWLTPVK